jgi:NADPH-dependent ferric siderophore reductase
MSDDRKTTKLRHESARRRVLTVVDKQYLTPHYLSVRFHCADFGAFSSVSPDDHIKLFLPGGRTEAGKPLMRDYTPRAFDRAAQSFVIDFALHREPGPATAWALAAESGDRLEIGGPRGSVVVSDQFATYWLIGDEAAIPSILRRLAEWPAARIRALVAVTGTSEEILLPQSTSHDITWVHRPESEAANSALLLDAFTSWFKPAEDCFVWVATESGVARALRNAVLETGHPASRLRVSGYWTLGKADTTEKFD